MDGLFVFASGARGAAVIERLADEGHRIAGVVLPGGRAPLPELTALAKRRNLHLTTPDDVNAPEFLDLLAHRGVTLSVVAGFPAIFARKLIDLPVRGTINLHAGPLPGYRGGSPLQWQVINGESRAGISVIRMDEGIDTGPILAEDRFAIPPDATIADLQSIASGRFADLAAQCVKGLEEGSLIERQQTGPARYWHQRNEADGRIDFARMDARQVHNLIRAITWPYPGAFAFLGRHPVRFWKARVAELPLCGVPGRVVRVQGEGPYIVCREGAILAEEVQMAGGWLKSGQRLM